MTGSCGRGSSRHAGDTRRVRRRPRRRGQIKRVARPRGSTRKLLKRKPPLSQERTLLSRGSQVRVLPGAPIFSVNRSANRRTLFPSQSVTPFGVCQFPRGKAKRVADRVAARTTDDPLEENPRYSSSTAQVQTTANDAAKRGHLVVHTEYASQCERPKRR